MMSAFRHASMLGVVTCLFGSMNGFLSLQDMSKMSQTASPWTESVFLSHRVVTDVYFGGRRLAEVFMDEEGFIHYCNMLGDRALINKLLFSVPIYVVDHVNVYQMNNVVHQCAQRPQNAKNSYFPKLQEERHQGAVMFPGTKWCGAGNVASNYDDLGKAWEADMCCREHDLAKESIPAFGAKRGVKNMLFYTMTSCDADKKFFKCLLKAQSFTSFSLGVGYFDILRTKCYQYGHPTKCVDKQTTDNPKSKLLCKKFKTDTWKARKWRVYDPPNFFKAYVMAKTGNENGIGMWTSATEKK
ncbi:phospholipase A2 hemilipin-like isoform X1 [Dermacentor andersoni]|uniref:phospholipase A2 hemilipin-like isoform X1 n=1 Tax=Dermacentor andersoni TaxID=34620 RepID=UPI002155DD4F|nr:phospholipase A2 hemilipin-like isoform X1 [Dermacentor andersoni]